MQVFYSLISSLKTYHRYLHFNPWSLDLFIYVPFQLPGEHTVLQPFRRIELIVHIAISVLPHHLNNVPTLRGEKHDISQKILHQAGFETARQATTSAERHDLTIASCPSLIKYLAIIIVTRNWVCNATEFYLLLFQLKQFNYKTWLMCRI